MQTFQEAVASNATTEIATYPPGLLSAVIRHSMTRASPDQPCWHFALGWTTVGAVAKWEKENRVMTCQPCTRSASR